MPIYEYKCRCGKEKEAFIPFSDSEDAQICGCGDVMLRKVSVVNFYTKPTGRGMALDSLNSKATNHIKVQFKNLAAQGL